MSVAATQTPLSLSDRLACIVGLLCRAVADHGPKQAATRPMLVPAWTRLRRLCGRFAALAAAVEAGRKMAPRSRPEGARRPAASPTPIRLPGRFGWLLELAPHVDTRIARAQVEHWLADPALTALVETTPRAGRILRPLCRMLAIEPPPALRLPKVRQTRRGPTPAAPTTIPGALPDAPPQLPSWLRAPPSPPLPGLQPVEGSWASFVTKPDPSPD